ncbi:MAG: helix-turn-helix domain-containing protein [Syntrophomonadaceae bacterium]
MNSTNLAGDKYSHNLQLGMDWQDLPAFFGPRELSAFMGIGITKAYQLSRSVGFPAIRIGKNIRISRDGLRRWVQMQTEEEI